MVEVRKRILSIIYVLLFLGLSTWFFYGPRKYLTYVAMNYNRMIDDSRLELSSSKLEFGNNKFTVYNKSNNKVEYQLVINNDYTKLRSSNCKALSNNYIEYHIRIDDKYDIKRVLSSDGIIYRGTIDKNEKIDFNLYLENNSASDSSCFYPTLHTYNEDNI